MTDQPRRFMLDSNAFDAIVDAGLVDVLNALRHVGVEVLVHSRLQNQIDAIPGERGDAARQITTTPVSMGVSRWGAAKWGEMRWGANGGRGVGYEQAMGNANRTRGNLDDMQIATAAARESDVLVTADAKMAKRVRKTNDTFPVWSPEDFVRWVERQAHPGDTEPEE